MSEATPRKVGFATGQTDLREVMFRSEFADGTSVDTEPMNPAKVPKSNGLVNLALRIADGGATSPKPVRVVRYERTVTIWVGEWAPVPEVSQPEPEAAAS